MNSKENIQEGSRNGPQNLEFDKRACELILPGARLITRSQLERFLQNVMTINSRD